MEFDKKTPDYSLFFTNHAIDALGACEIGGQRIKGKGKGTAVND